MGRDKAVLEIGGETLAGLAARRLREVCAEVIVADAGRQVLAGSLSVPDGPGRGPAAGILGAARARPGSPLLVLAVDLPRVPVPLLEELARPGFDLVLPRWTGGIEPLCAFYGPAAVAVLEARVARGRLDLHSLADEPGLAVRWLEEAEIRRFGEPAELFVNLNRPEDVPGVETPG